MTDRTASPTTVAFRNLPADIQALSFDAVGHLPRPMSHMEMLLAVGQAVLAERERCAQIIEARLPLYTELGQRNALKESISSIRSAGE